MTYPLLAAVFFATIAASVVMLMSLVLKPTVYRRHSEKIWKAFASWVALYAIFIFLFTGPTNLNEYPPQSRSPYRLPWSAGVSRWVAQGNRSFTSHRDFHHYAWDFVMPNGTEILATRDGIVIEVEDHFDGIGLNSNYLIIEHEDGERSAYAHIRLASALVKVGDHVKQGQPIAFSGMVGQTIFPHLHFYVMNKEGTSSIPISFGEVPGGIPVAGHFYTSENGTK